MIKCDSEMRLRDWGYFEDFCFSLEKHSGQTSESNGLRVESALIFSLPVDPWTEYLTFWAPGVDICKVSLSVLGCILKLETIPGS